MIKMKKKIEKKIRRRTWEEEEEEEEEEPEISLRSSKEDIENSSFRPQFGGLERRDSKTEDCTDAHAHHTRLGGITSTSEPESVEEPATSNDLPDLPATIPASSPSLSSDDHCRIRSATLPDFQSSSSPAFMWGEEVHGETFVSAVKDAYQEVVRWRPNHFSIPLGAVGKKFVVEVTRLVRAFAEGSALESVALWALTIMPSLLLQQPSSSSSHHQRTDCLQRRLVAWQSGNIQDLLLEGRVLQNDLIRRTRRKRSPAEEEASLSRSFSRLMAQGKVKAALRLLSSQSKGKVLNPDDIASGVESAEAQPKTVLDTLKEKHPEASAISWDAVLDSEPAPSHPVVFERLTGDTIRHAALHCQGAAGPSGLDANCWWRLCTMFHGASKQLCEALTAATRRLCTSFIDPTIIRPFIACRLIPLSKNPGVRPIGICDTLRRIMGKAILNVIGAEIQAVAGSSQLCARQRSGCEAAVHAMTELFNNEQVEGLLLVDAHNAFNSLNRAVMLQNIQVTCPSLAVPVINMYRSDAELFVGEETIFSREGTTQGDPLSMAVYALSTLPLISKRSQPNLTQTWFADDAGGEASLQVLHQWWTALSEVGPRYGYYVNPPKTWVLVKEQFKDSAQELFGKYGIQITTQGRPLLGAPIGTADFSDQYINDMVSCWDTELKVLTGFASLQPQAAYAAYTHGLHGKWSYLSRACHITKDQFCPLEERIRRSLIPAISGRAVNDDERDLLGLPARMGGLGLANPASEAEFAYATAAGDEALSGEHPGSKRKTNGGSLFWPALGHHRSPAC